MSDDVLGTCCSVLLITVHTICAGFCQDFASLRASFDAQYPNLDLRDNQFTEHQCTATLFSCGCCGREEEPEMIAEREPLLQENNSIEPSAVPPMESKAPVRILFLQSWVQPLIIYLGYCGSY